jgi:hypothetical protein
MLAVLKNKCTAQNLEITNDKIHTCADACQTSAAYAWGLVSSMQAKHKNRVRHGIDCTMLLYVYALLHGWLA